MPKRTGEPQLLEGRRPWRGPRAADRIGLGATATSAAGSLPSSAKRRRWPLLATACLVACGLLVPGLAKGQAPLEFYAVVDRDRIALDETLILTVTLTMRGKDPSTVELPQAPDFEVVSQGTSSHSSFSFGTGGTSRTRTRTYELVLRPLREGTLRIPPGVAVLDGERYQTAEIRVEVGPAGSGRPPPQAVPPRRPTTPFGGIPGFDDDFDPFGRRGRPSPPPTEGELMLVASLDREEAYVGEQVTLTISLRSRRDVSGIPHFQMPRFDGFWAEDLESPTRIEGQTEIIDGVPWRVYLLRRRALFPLREGELRIEPAQVELELGGSLFSRAVRLSRESEALTLQVKPLPPGAPPGFAPANVGQWELRASAQPTTAAVGAPITLRLRAEGSGNLSNLELPALPPVEGLKAFDPIQHDEVRIQRWRYGGSRTQEYVLVPQREGTLTIPPITLDSFDPATGQYRVSRTQPITLQILPGQGSPGQAASGAQPPPSIEAESGTGLAGIRAATVIEPRRRPLHERPWFAAALLLPALAVLGAAIVPRVAAARARGEDGRRKKGAGRVARRRLAAARALATAGDAAFYTELDQALHAYLELKLGRSTAGMSRDGLDKLLEERGVEAGIRAELREALETCDVGRFAPGALDEGARARALDLAAAAIDGIEASPLGGSR